MLLEAIYDHSGPKLHVFGPIITFRNTDMYSVSKIFLGHSRSFCHISYIFLAAIVTFLILTQY